MKSLTESVSQTATTKPTGHAKRRANNARYRVQPRIQVDLVRRLRALAAARGSTENAIMEEALRQYLDGTSEMTLLLRDLARLGRQGARVHRDLEILSEAFAIWTKIQFSHMPAVAADDKRAARALGESRYQQFVKHLAEQYSGGKRFLDDLPRESFGDETELKAAAEAPTPPNAPGPTEIDTTSENR